MKIDKFLIAFINNSLKGSFTASVNNQNLKLATVEILGQTTSTWVEIGDFDFTFSAKPYLKILANGTSGNISANAILLVPSE